MGTYGNPNTSYHGPGMQHLNMQGLEERYHPELGKGVVLGKYSRTISDSKKVVDYDVKRIDQTDAMYHDAMELAHNSGLGYSALSFED